MLGILTKVSLQQTFATNHLKALITRSSGSEAAAETPRPIAWPSFFEPRLLACGARGIVGAQEMMSGRC
jgi:hypothetical protein